MRVRGQGGEREASVSEPADRGLTEALLRASRTLVAVAARSLDDLEDALTLPQFRALVVLQELGPSSTTVLADRVGVHQSTATRMTDGMARQHLVERRKDDVDRRVTLVSLSDRGRELVEQVMQRRRDEIAAVVAAMQPQDVTTVVEALTAFTRAWQGLHVEQDVPVWRV